VHLRDDLQNGETGRDRKQTGFDGFSDKSKRMATYYQINVTWPFVM